MKLPKFIHQNLLLKITSLNAGVISVRLIISLFIQRLLAQVVGEAGIAQIGSLRNVLQMLTSITSLGTFNGIIKYLAEFKNDRQKLQQLFSTAFVFTVIGCAFGGILLFFKARWLSEYLFYTQSFEYIIKLVAVVVPFIGLQRVFNGVVNGLSAYKNFAKIDLAAYLLSSIVLIIFLFQHNIDGALIAIAITPCIQLLILVLIFWKELKKHVQFSKLQFKTPMANSLLAFSLMSFVSTVLLNYVEIDVRGMIENEISKNEAGIWTAMTNISKNYMVFSTALFSLYVLPKFSGIHTERDFKNEVLSIYKTLLPIFGVGMVLVFFLRSFIVQIVYPGFEGLQELFKWQLLGDFIRLASVILAHQFLAKKMVRNFIFTELLSLALFFGLAYYLVGIYGVEGVVLAHFIRYILYFVVVVFLLRRYFAKKRKPA